MTIYLARYFPGPGEDHLGVIGSSYRPTGVNRHLYPDPYQITFSIGQAVFQVFGHSGTAPVEICRAGQLDSGLIVPLGGTFRQLWPSRSEDFAWPPREARLSEIS